MSADQLAVFDRWKCPDCGKVYVDPPSAIATCSCGSDRIQLRQFPYDEDWTQPEWPDDSEYSPNSFKIEGEIKVFESGQTTTGPRPADQEEADE